MAEHDKDETEQRNQLLRLAFWRGRRMSTATVLFTQAAADATRTASPD